jgi:hypothetical protein
VTGEMVAYFNSMKRQMFFQCPEGFAHITKWLQFLDGGLSLIDKIKLFIYLLGRFIDGSG